MRVEQALAAYGRPCGTHRDGRKLFVYDGKLYVQHTNEENCLGDWFEVCDQVRRRERFDLILDHIVYAPPL